MVGDVSYRVDGFLGRSGSNQNLFACHILFIGKSLINVLTEHLRLRHFTRSRVSAGQMALCRLYDLPAVLSEYLQVVLNHRVQIHLRVHCRSYELRACAACQHRSCQHVVCDAVGQLGYYISRSRSDNDCVCLFGHSHMLHFKFKISVKGVHQAFMPGKCFENNRIDEVLSILCHENFHVISVFYQHAGQGSRLVSGYSSRYSQQYRLLFFHEKIPFSQLYYLDLYSFQYLLYMSSASDPRFLRVSHFARTSALGLRTGLSVRSAI